MRSLENKARLARVAFVGVPCHVNAVRKIGFLSGFLKKKQGERDFDYPLWPSRILTIGLFCRENFSREALARFLSERFDTDWDEIRKIDCSRGKFTVYTDKGKQDVPISETKKVARNCCAVCPDLSSEFADISVGNMGSPDGYNTLIVRTELGRRVVQSAIASGVIEVGREIDTGELEKQEKNKAKAARKEHEERKKEGKVALFQETLTKENLDEFLDAAGRNDFDDLEKDVIFAGACVYCGACSVVCPEDNLFFEDGRPYRKEKCPENCGACYAVCPRTHSLVSYLAGETKEIYSARATSIDYAAQDGGVATALLCHAVEREFVDAVTTIKGERALLTNEKGDIKKGAGTKHFFVPVALLLRR